VRHGLWVTAYDPEHRYPAGDFPNQNPRPDLGLPTWVKVRTWAKCGGGGGWG
jgi:primary-amine oxidase